MLLRLNQERNKVSDKIDYLAQSQQQRKMAPVKSSSSVRASSSPPAAVESEIQEPVNVRNLVKKFTPLGFSSDQCEGAAILRTIRHESPENKFSQVRQIMNASPEIQERSPSPAPRQQQPSAAADPSFLLVFSSGAAADHQSDKLGLYRKTEEVREGCSVYSQMHDTKYGVRTSKLLSDKGVWSFENDNGNVRLRVTTPNDSPTSAKWQYYDWDKKTWYDDPAFTVTSLSEKPSDCEVTISLSEDNKRDIKEPGVEGLYKADRSYGSGRPVLQQEGGIFTLFVRDGCWNVSAGFRGYRYLKSGSAPSQCPADPRAARDERLGLTQWTLSKPSGYTESSGISIKCNNHKY